jgi:hypothetical protein
MSNILPQNQREIELQLALAFQESGRAKLVGQDAIGDWRACIFRESTSFESSSIELRLRKKS